MSPIGCFFAHMSAGRFFGLVISVLFCANLHFALLRGETFWVMTANRVAFREHAQQADEGLWSRLRSARRGSLSAQRGDRAGRRSPGCVRRRVRR